MKALALMAISVALLTGCTAPSVSIEEQAREIVLDSYERFESDGATETLSNTEGTWDLLFDPSREDYQAAWFNRDTGESELIFETDYFSVFVAYLMLSDRELEISVLEDGFRMQSENWAEIDFVVENNLIVGASSEAFEPWSSKIIYAVDPKLREQLVDLERELLADFQTES